MSSHSEIRKAEIEILNYVVSICEENNIEYYLDYGTLLGAIRHQGFIPWDDDIDISIPRKDYEKFLSICKNKNSQKFFLQTYDSDKEYYQYYAKMRNTNTTFIEKDMQYLKFNQGIYIDIFPIDSFQSKNTLQYIKLIVAVTINKICTFVKNPYAYVPYRIAKVIKFIFKPIRASFLNRLIENLLRNNKQSNYFYTLGNGYNFKKIITKDILLEKEKHVFEQNKYQIPKRYDEYLTLIYGNYMSLPPEEKRVFPHEAIVVDTKKGYKEYVGKMVK